MKEYEEKYKNWMIDNVVDSTFISSIHTKGEFKLGFVLFTPVALSLIKDRLLKLRINGKEPDYILVCTGYNVNNINYCILRGQMRTDICDHFQNLTLLNFCHRVNVISTVGTPKKGYKDYDRKFKKENQNILSLISGGTFTANIKGDLEEMFGDMCTFRLSSINGFNTNVVNFYVKDDKVFFPDYDGVNLYVGEFLTQITTVPTDSAVV